MSCKGKTKFPARRPLSEIDFEETLKVFLERLVEDHPQLERADIRRIFYDGVDRTRIILVEEHQYLLRGNAKLMAAAPEMYELITSNFAALSMEDLKKKIEAIVKKVEGETP